MKFTVKSINLFVMFKIPSAYISGVRLVNISDSCATVSVRKGWINQNPFKSMYWATQGMASELATGVLVMKSIKASNRKISMLVTHQEGTFTKKALGKITFMCNEGAKVDKVIQQAIDTGEGQELILVSEGYDMQNELVATFKYVWSLKLK